MKRPLRTALVLWVSLFLVSGLCACSQTTQKTDELPLSDGSEPVPPDIVDGVVVRFDTAGGVVLSEQNPVYDQEDVDTHFVHYASGDSRVSLPTVQTDVDSAVSNVVGVVLDFEDDTPIPGALVAANGTELVSTDDSGRFQITNLPDGEYDWEVTAEGYMKGSYFNYAVTNAGGANIFRFYLSCDEAYISNREDMDHVN